MDVLNMDYPLYKDIILKQVEEKKKEKEALERQKQQSGVKKIGTRKGPIK